tara:strand:+ start:760 stop:897 length:138 start_codon:yes stop_codon:yes gene_type:complete
MVTDKDAKELEKTLEEVKKKADEDYQAGGAYKAFLKIIREAKQDD